MTTLAKNILNALCENDKLDASKLLSMGLGNSEDQVNLILEQLRNAKYL